MKAMIERVSSAVEPTENAESSCSMKRDEQDECKQSKLDVLKVRRCEPHCSG